jgi:hypothetical protein
MYSRALLVFVLIACLGSSTSSSWAKKKQKQQATQDSGATIVEVNFVSVTVNSGDQAQETYKITDATKVTLNTLPATTDDLMAGMQATITASPDNTTALQIDAKNAKVIPNKR